MFRGANQQQTKKKMQAAGRLAYMIPSQNMEFDTALMRLFERQRMLCIGTRTGEVLVYLYSVAEGKFAISPKRILLPHPRQKAGAVRDIAVADALYEEIMCSTGKLIVTLHDDNRLRTWNTADGKCMCVSLPGTFSGKLASLQTTKLRRYVAAVGNDCTIYLVDIVTMRILKIYTTSDQQYVSHVYVQDMNAMWVVDSRCGFFFWKLADIEDIKMVKKFSSEQPVESEIPRQMNPLPSATVRGDLGRLNAVTLLGEKDLLAVFDRQICVLHDPGVQTGQELQQRHVQIVGQEGRLVSATTLERQRMVVVISSTCKVYHLVLDDLLNPALSECKSKLTVSLKGFRSKKKTFFLESRARVLYAAEERTMLAVREKKQTFYVWELSGTAEAGANSVPASEVELVGYAQKPWRMLASSDPNQIRINTYLDTCGYFTSRPHMCVFRPKEEVTASVIQTSSELCSPSYIVGTSQGRVLIFRVFMSDTRYIEPILVVEGRTAVPINRLCVAKDKLIAASVDGTVSITDLSPAKLQTVTEEYYSVRNDRPLDADEKFVHNYTNSCFLSGLIPSGVSGFLELQALDQSRGQQQQAQEVSKTRPEPEKLKRMLEDQIGIVGCDKSLLLLSLSEAQIVAKYKGHDGKVIGAYVDSSLGLLLVLTKTPSMYVYSLGSGTVERRLAGPKIAKLLDLDEKVAKRVSKDGKMPKCSEIAKLYSPKGNVLKQGCHKSLHFSHSMEQVQTDWKNPAGHKERLYKTLCFDLINRKDIKEPWKRCDVLLKLFNKVQKMHSKLTGRFGCEAETGFAAIQLRIGRESPKLVEAVKHKHAIFKGNLGKAADCSVIILQLDDLLLNLQKNSVLISKVPPMLERGDSCSPRRAMDMRQSPQKDTAPPPEPTISSDLKAKADALWPLPLVSLMHCFGLNRRIDKDLSDEFCICPPLLQLWVGVPGVESTFSFSVPDVFDPDWPTSQGLFNWKVSSGINTVQSMVLFSSLVTIFHFNDQFVASVLNRLLGVILTHLSTNASLPYISFMKISYFLGSRDPDVWSASRDIVLRPFLKKARNEGFMMLASQLAYFVNGSYERLKKDPEYPKAKTLLRERGFPGKFDFLQLINKYLGEVELRSLTMLTYIFAEHSELVATPKIIKRCLKLVCLLIGEITSKPSATDLKFVLINLLMLLSNNASAFKECMGSYVHQLFRQLIHIYASSTKSRSDNIVLKIQSEKYNLTKPLSSMIQYLPSVADAAIVAVAEQFNNELVALLYADMLKKDISMIPGQLVAQQYSIDLIEIVRSIVRRIGGCLLQHLPTFGNMILAAVDLAKEDQGKILIESVTHLVQTMLFRYQNVQEGH